MSVSTAILNKANQNQARNSLSSYLANPLNQDNSEPEDKINPEVGCCRLIKNLFSPAECLNLIQYAKGLGYAKASPAYPPSYRNNERLVIDDSEFATALFQRVRRFLPHQILDSDGSRWQLVGINERFRFCRYEAGQFFKIHRDGVYHRSNSIQSKLTFMVYLNDAKEFVGGSTRFFASRDPNSKILAAIAPQQGALIYFDHDLWHDGQELSGGEKFIMRSDILYERVSSSTQYDLKESSQNHHSGYIWASTETSKTTFATGGRDKTIRIWHRTSGEVTLSETLYGHQNSVTALLAVGPSELWSGSRDRTIRVWKTEEGSKYRCDQCLEGHTGAVLSLAMSPDAQVVASSSADHTICLWDRDGRRMAVLSGHTGWVWCVRFLTSSTVVSASEDGTLRLWNTKNGKCLATYNDGDAPLRILTISESGHQIIVGRADGVINIWTQNQTESENKFILSNTLNGHTGEVRALTLLSDDILASGAEDDSIKVWSLLKSTVTSTYLHGDFVTSLTKLADGELISTSYDGTIRSWHNFGSSVKLRRSL